MRLRFGMIAAVAIVTLMAGTSSMSADKQRSFESGVLDFGLSGNVEIPSLSAGRDGRIYCVFSQDTKAIWIAATHDGGKTWGRPARVMGCPGPGYITDANALVRPGRITVYAAFVPDEPGSQTRRSQFLASSSTDDGATWSKPAPLPVDHRYVVGKIHPPVWLDDKTVVMGYSWDLNADLGKPFKDEPGMCLRSGALISTDAGLTWTPGNDAGKQT